LTFTWWLVYDASNMFVILFRPISLNYSIFHRMSNITDKTVRLLGVWPLGFVHGKQFGRFMTSQMSHKLYKKLNTPITKLHVFNFWAALWHLRRCKCPKLPTFSTSLATGPCCISTCKISKITILISADFFLVFMNIVLKMCVAILIGLICFPK